MKLKQRFQDNIMQTQYEKLVNDGLHWKTAEKKIIKIFEDYDNKEGI